MKKRSKSILYLVCCIAALILCIAIAVMLVLSKGAQGPATLDTGTSAGAWAKNDKGFYFNTNNEAITAATLKGIDVSAYQGEVDWQKAKDAGIDFAILRCGYGSEWNGEGDYKQDDETWRHNADECTRLGIPFGTYLYSYATTEEQARSEADHVARLLGLMAPEHEGLGDYTAAPYKLNYPVYYDLEDKSITGLYPSEMANLVTAFFDQLKSRGYTGSQGLYASINWVRGRFDDPAFDAWRDNLWIARYAPSLGYTGTYAMWQSTYQEPGATYGVQSDTVDVDFVMEDLTVTGVTGVADAAKAGFTNDTYKSELWLAAKGDQATLTLSEPAEGDGGQKIYYASSDEKVAVVSKSGVIKAKGSGQCTVTATLADGRETAECTVRVGKVTVPIFATAGLAGDLYAENRLAAVAALKADTPDSILTDVGGGLQGTAPASLTGGMDMTTAFSNAGYDVHTFSAADLAYGSARLVDDTVTAAGPALAANLLTTATNTALFDRATCQSRNRISNGMNCIVREAGKKIGFFALSGLGTAGNAGELTAADLLATAADQVAALKAQGADAIICLAAQGSGAGAQWKELQALGVNAILDADAQKTAGAQAAVGGANGVAKLELSFAADGSVSAQGSNYTYDQLAALQFGDSGKAAYDAMNTALQTLSDGDNEVRAATLFTLAEPKKKTTETITFGNYVAQAYLNLYTADRDNLPADYYNMYPSALAGGVGTLPVGEVTRGALLDALPAGARIQLVLTTGKMYAELLAQDTVSQVYAESLKQKDAVDGPILIVTDTATLATLSDQSYTVVRDYGDAFWAVRMALNDDTQGFTTEFTLPAAT